MDRKEFISVIGIGAVSALIAGSMSACTKDPSPANSAVDFKLDLNASENTALKNTGGYIVTNGVIVALSKTGVYIAVSAACTHQGTTVEYNNTVNRFQCPNHGSEFSATGNVVTGPAASSLTRYNAILSGNTLRIFE
jgi:cytochrome b6-f complex iron-sulfur subunit